MPSALLALGLGQLELETNLNDPLEARIQLLSVTAEELDTLSVKLADADAFDRAGVDRPFLLTSLRFEVVMVEDDSEPDYIRVFTREAVREPYLNFLVEAAWSKGRLFREYTVLLDPPLYDPYARQTAIRMPDATDLDTDSGGDTSYDDFVQDLDDQQVGSGSSTPVMLDSDLGDYGPTSASDTLWSIASTTRPDSSISVQQMMLALLRANPEAFQDNNINGLKRGQILRLPGRDEILSYTQAEALAEARSQNSSWEQTYGAFDTPPPSRPVSTTSDATYESDDSSVEDSSRVQIIAASETGVGTEQGDSTGFAGNADSDQSLALASEELQAVAQQNQDLRDRLDEAEGLITDLQRLIELKDDELAALQERVAAGEEQAAAVDDMPVTTDVDSEDGLLLDETGLEEPDEFDLSLDDDAVIDDSMPVDDGIQDTGTEDVIDETPVDDEADDNTSSLPPAPSQPIAQPQSLVDTVIQTVMDNIMLVAAGAGGLIVIVLAFTFLRGRKKKSAAVTEAAAITSFPENEGSEEETILPGESIGEAEAEFETDLPPDISEEPAAVEEEAAAEPVVEETPAEAEPVAEEPEEDPLDEVNVFLAYEHFDQAEEFVRAAITKDPENLEYHSKLLEVFYTSGDKAKYEQAAADLNDLTGGEGTHWEMALAMWSELSPNRGLFEEGEDDEDTPAETTGGGMLDLTADESDSGEQDMGVDFDLGDMTAEDDAGDAVEEEDILDVTAAVSMDDIDDAVDSDSGEDLLDVTSAVGLEPESSADAAESDDEELLDFTSATEEPAEDILDVSAQGGGDDLLDVTASTDADSMGDDDEDLLDVTSATSAGADSDELLEVSDSGGDVEAEAEDSLDLDLGLGDSESEAEDNVLDFDASGSTGDGDDDVEETLKIDMPDSAGDSADLDLGLDMDLGSDDEESSGLEIPGAEDDADSDSETMDMNLDTLDSETEDDAGLEIDLSVSDDTDDAASLELDMDSSTDEESSVELDLSDDMSDSDDAGGLDLELDSDSSDSDDGGLELDMGDLDDGDSDISGLSLEMDSDDDEDDDDEHTVFVPRSGNSEEQSEADEIATKLDLAKAYVELGDKDSAKGILDEIINEGNDEQKAAAQDLLKQVT